VKRTPRPNRVSGLQAAQVALRADLTAFEQLLPPDEYATLVDVHARVLEHERKRTARWLRRRQ